MGHHPMQCACLGMSGLVLDLQLLVYVILPQCKLVGPEPVQTTQKSCAAAETGLSSQPNLVCSIIAQPFCVIPLRELGKL